MTAAAFWDKIAPKYAKRPIEDIPAYEATLDRTRSFLHQSDRILEIGCGTGGTALLLSPSVQHVTATDISPKMIAIANSKLSNGPENITFQQATALSPLASGPYDAICAFNILHLLENLPKALAHLKSSVKPGGFVITKTPCLGEMNIALHALIRLMQLVGKAPYVNSFTIEELETAFKEAGFDLVETGHFTTRTNNRFIVARRATNKEDPS